MDYFYSLIVFIPLILRSFIFFEKSLYIIQSITEIICNIAPRFTAIKEKKSHGYY